MAGAAISLERMAGRLRGAAAALRSPPAPLMKVLKTAILADAKLNFDQSADPDGKGWLPLAHPRASGGDKPLRDKGLLMASLTAGPSHIDRSTDTAIIVGTNRVGATLHQHGGTVRPKKGRFLTIPATREAARYAAPNFPRELVAVVGKKGGVLREKASQGRGKKKAPGKVQYFLVRSVTVPARPFLGMGSRLRAKLSLLATDYLGRVFKGR